MNNPDDKTSRFKRAVKAVGLLLFAVNLGMLMPMHRGECPVFSIGMELGMLFTFLMLWLSRVF